jgi:hypothetical protein
MAEKQFDAKDRKVQAFGHNDMGGDLKWQVYGRPMFYWHRFLQSGNFWTP